MYFKTDAKIHKVHHLLDTPLVQQVSCYLDEESILAFGQYFCDLIYSRLKLLFTSDGYLLFHF